jgi:hypothetical protein
MQCLRPARQETEASSHVVEGLPSHPAGPKEGLDWMAPQLLARPLGLYGKAGYVGLCSIQHTGTAANKAVVTGHHLNPTIQLIWNRCAAVMGIAIFFA